jgi:hypothetical protein
VDDALFADLRAAVAADAPRESRARVVAGLVRHATGARWVGVYTVADGLVSNEGWSGPGAPAHPTFPTPAG